MNGLSLRLLLLPVALTSLSLSPALLTIGCGPGARPAPPPPSGSFGEGLVAFRTPPTLGDIDPKKLFDEGQSLQDAGEYDQARDRYSAILLLAPAAPEAAGARFNLGVIAYQTADYSAAAEAFTLFRQRHPDHPKAALALFWLAETQRERGEDRAALAFYDEFLGSYPQVEDQVRLRRAKVHLRAKDPATAAAELRAALATAGARGELRRQYADLLLSHGQPQSALQLYRELYSATSGAWARAELLYLIAQAQRAVGDEAYMSTLAEVVRSHPASYYAKLALEAVVQHSGLAITPYQEGRVLYYQREDASALEAFKRQERTLPGSGETPWARYRSALVYQRLGRNEEALVELNGLIRDYPTGEVFRDALWEKASLLEYLGRHEGAAATYREFAARFTGSREAREASFRDGLSHYRMGDLHAAAGTWGTLLSLAGAQDKLWTEAEHGPGAQARDFEGKIALWLGKARQGSGDRSGAQQAYRLAQQARPGRYYAQRAETLQKTSSECGAGALTCTFNYRPLSAGISMEEDAEVREWILGWSTPNGDIQPLASPLVRRGALFSDMGLHNEATEEFRTAVKAAGSDPMALYQVARFLHNRRQHGAAIAAALLLWNDAPEHSLEQLPRGLLKVLYPVPYGAQVVQSAREWSIDPLLLYSVMRQESLFNPMATSGASAKGLTQVIPSTGREIARALGLSAFTSEDLYRPSLSIRFGAYYLSKQLEHLGHPVFAMAAYNAGTGSALRWMGHTQKVDPDLFVENIDYEETSLYVRVVMENYAYYTKLYGER